MTTTVAAIKGKFGNTIYYLMKMNVGELVKLVKIPDEGAWKKTTLEERYQRDLKINRIRRDIVPYLEKNNSRFFGSVIVASDVWEEGNFEPIDSFIGDTRLSFGQESEMKKMGFYNFLGSENLYVLDGQHRVKSLQFALKVVDGSDSSSESNPEIAKDEISVLVIEYDIKKAREIFTTINRQAKTVSTGETLITDDNDIVAVISRKVSNELIAGRLVNYASNNLTEKDHYFTTLATVANATETFLQQTHRPGKDFRKKLPSRETQEDYEKGCFDFWEKALDGIVQWKETLTDRDSADTKVIAEGDAKRKKYRTNYVCMRPMPQKCIMAALAYVTNLSEPLGIVQGIEKLNSINWLITRKLWDRLLISGGKIQAKNEKVIRNVLIYILMGYKVDSEFEKRLLADYNNIFPEEEKGKVNLDWIKSFHEDNKLPD